MFFSASPRAETQFATALDTNDRLHTPADWLSWSYWTMMLGAFLLAICLGVGNTWDGAYLMFKAVNDQTPYVPHGRTAEVILQWPVIWLSSFTSNIMALRIAYSAMYAAVPIIALIVCWWITRATSRNMFVWAAIGIGLATLPGQINLAAEANIPAQLFWPVLLAILVGVDRKQFLVVLLLCLFILVSHPFAVLMFAVGAAAAALLLFIRRRFTPEALALPVMIGVFLLAAIIKYVILRSTYDDDQVSPSIWTQHFSQAVAGKPLVMLLIILALGVLVVGLPYATDRRARAARLESYATAFAVACCALLLLLGVSWALAYRAWGGASDYRTFIGPITAGVMALAILDAAGVQAGRIVASQLDRQLRDTIVLGSAVVFLAVFALQVVTWSNLTDRLKGDVAQSAAACVPVASLHWVDATSFGHWSATPLSLLLQGRTPSKVVVTTPTCAQAGLQAGMPVSNFDRIHYTGGWFSLGRVGRAVAPAAGAVGAAPAASAKTPR